MHDYLYRFWSNGFWPLPPRTAGEWLWLLRNLRGFWGQSLFDYPLSPLYLALTILGFWAMWRRRRDAALLLLGPAAAMLAASAARQYPFHGRLLLPLAPAFLLAASEGAGFLAARRLVPPPAAALLAIPPLLALLENRPVHRAEETRPMLAHVAAHRRKGDAIYVSYGAVPAFRWYGPRYGLQPLDAISGRCHRGEPREYLHEIDALRGRSRVWVLFAHDVPRLGEQALIQSYLQQIGVRRDRFVVPVDGPSEVLSELYDLGIPERLASASAGTFPLPEGDDELAHRLGCGSDSPASRVPVRRAGD